MNLAEAMEAHVRERGRQIMETAAGILEGALLATTPVDSGNLLDHTNVYGPEDRGDRYTLTLVQNVDYASYVREGTEAHDVFGNPYLAFYWKKVGKFMILNASVKPVHIPAHDANPYIDNLIANWHDTLAQAL